MKCKASAVSSRGTEQRCRLTAVAGREVLSLREGGIKNRGDYLVTLVRKTASNYDTVYTVHRYIYISCTQYINIYIYINTIDIVLHVCTHVVFSLI